MLHKVQLSYMYHSSHTVQTSVATNCTVISSKEDRSSRDFFFIFCDFWSQTVIFDSKVDQSSSCSCRSLTFLTVSFCGNLDFVKTSWRSASFVSFNWLRFFFFFNHKINIEVNEIEKISGKKRHTVWKRINIYKNISNKICPASIFKIMKI